MRANVSVKCLALLIVWQFCGFSILTSAFGFSFGAPTQCDNLLISWSGGRPPFYLLITPLFDTPRNISIPDAMYNSDERTGTFSTQLTLAAGSKFLLTMSDADGFATGGTSDVLVTGSSANGTRCNTTSQDVDFFFELNTALQQCRNYIFSGYGAAIQPVTIFGLIPLGQAFVLTPPEGPNSFNWIANVAGGTSIAFLMRDAQGRNGGASDTKVVGWTDNSSCLDESSPHSTVSGSFTVTSNADATQTAGTSSRVEAGVIAGAVVGASASVVVVLLLALYLVRRKKRSLIEGHGENASSKSDMVVIGGPGGASRVSRVRSSLHPASRRRTHPTVDLIANRPVTEGGLPSALSLPRTSEYEPNPFILPSKGSVASVIHSNSDTRMFAAYNRSSRPLSQPETMSHYDSDIDGLGPNLEFTRTQSNLAGRRPSLPLTYVSGSTSRKASLIGNSVYASPRLILHTDAEDVPSVNGDDEDIVELPPQYNDRRTMSPRMETDAPLPSRPSSPAPPTH